MYPGDGGYHHHFVGPYSQQHHQMMEYNPDTQAAYSNANGYPITSSTFSPPIIRSTNPYHQQQREYSSVHQQQQQKRRNGHDTLLSMRKHRSLDGAQFLAQFDPGNMPNPTSTVYNAPPDILSSLSTPLGGGYGYHRPTTHQMPLHQQQQIGASISAPIHHQQNYPSSAANYDNSQLLLTRAPGPAPSAYPSYQSLANYVPPHTLPYQSHISVNTSMGESGGDGRFPPISQPAYRTMPDVNSDDPLAGNWLYYQPISAQSILQQTEFDPRALRREFSSICDRYNYLATSIRTFWAPELHRERQKRKEEALRASQLEQQSLQMNSETQILRMELDRRREEEDSGIGGRPRSHPRDFTDHSISLHEWQTLKSKLERSELTLNERIRDLQNAELRVKCAEEQKEEVERRNDILSRSNTTNEAQLKLLHEDLNVLRGKLELKNQQLEIREKANKKLETEMEALRVELEKSQQNMQESERRSAQLTHRLDQMERQLREQDLQLEQLRQRLLQQPSTRIEADLQQKLENAMEDRRKLEQLNDQLRHQNDTERQQQLQQFLNERDQLQANIAYLKKELADRHMLISSQSEKISQLDSAFKNAQQQNAAERGLMGITEEKSGTTESGGGSAKENETSGNSSSRDGIGITATAAGDELELERTHREMDRLLKRVQQLEREKAELMNAATTKRGTEGSSALSIFIGEAIEGTSDMSPDERVNALRQRIRDLEEALRESVECTAEKEKAMGEQKRLVEKLSTQVTEMFESGGTSSVIISQQRQTRDALAQLGEAQKQLTEERQQRQRQVTTVRKELGMALVAEKEAAIALIQTCCPNIEIVPGLREKLDSLQKQKEALKHALLMSNGGRGGSVDAGDEQFHHAQSLIQQQHSQQHQFAQMIGNPNPMAAGVGVGQFGRSASTMIAPGRPLSAAASLIQSPYPSYGLSQQSAAALSQPIRVQTSALHIQTMPPQSAGGHNAGNGGGFGLSAPASLNFYGSSGFDEYGQTQEEDGIWA